MNLQNVKVLYVLACIILTLIILSPTFFEYIDLPEGEKFSEIWLLNSDQTIDNAPFNIVANHTYSMHLGVANHMGDTKYYLVYVKLRNESEPAANRITGTPSSLKPIFEYRTFLKDGETYEQNVTFTFNSISFDSNVCHISKISINGNEISMNKAINWSSTDNGFYCQLFFELWIFDSAISDFQFHSRTVWLWLNLTQSS